MVMPMLLFLADQCAICRLLLALAVVADPLSRHLLAVASVIAVVVVPVRRAPSLGDGLACVDVLLMIVCLCAAVMAVELEASGVLQVTLAVRAQPLLRRLKEVAAAAILTS